MDIKLEPEDCESFPKTPQIDNNYIKYSSILQPCQNTLDFAIKQELEFNHRPFYEPMDNIKFENTKTEVAIKSEGDFGNVPHLVEKIGDNLFSYITFHSDSQDWDSVWIPKHIKKEEDFSLPFGEITIDEFDIKQEIARNALVAVVKLPKTIFRGRHFVCYICYDIFATSALLKRHRIRHGEPLFVNSSISFKTHSKKIVRVGDIKKILRKEENTVKIDVCQFKCKYLKQSQKPVLKNDMCNHKSKKKTSFNPYIHSAIFENEFHHVKNVKSNRMENLTTVNFRKKVLKEHDLYNFKYKKSNNLSVKLKSFKIFEDHSSVHFEQTILNCDLCDHKCESVSRLKKHKLTHTDEDVFDCKICGFKCRELKELSVHECVVGKSKKKSSRCDYQCNFFQRLKLLNIESSQKKTFICFRCNFFY